MTSKDKQLLTKLSQIRAKYRQLQYETWYCQYYDHLFLMLSLI